MQMQTVSKIYALCITAFATGLLAASCATPQKIEAPLSPAERIQQDIAVGAEVARDFDASLKFKQEKKINSYLNSLAQSLVDATPELRVSPVRVSVVKDPGAAWRDYGLPGHRIYLSGSLVKHIEFENQLAAAIAMELGHVLKRHPVIRMQEERLRAKPDAGKLDYLGEQGFFAYPDDFYADAADAAVGILYRAGYDPRGLVSLFQLFGANAERSPYGRRLLGDLEERARRAIALQSPLRNPIVRSQAFLSIQKRMRGL
jgi:predicted Zn-dependent protease